MKLQPHRVKLQISAGNIEQPYSELPWNVIEAENFTSHLKQVVNTVIDNLISSILLTPWI